VLLGLGAEFVRRSSKPAGSHVALLWPSGRAVAIPDAAQNSSIRQAWVVVLPFWGARVAGQLRCR